MKELLQPTTKIEEKKKPRLTRIRRGFLMAYGIRRVV